MLILIFHLLNRHPGYVLQQCAINNNVTHFTKIIENPNCGLEDLTYSKHDASESNPIMIAAKLRHKDLVSSILRSNKFENSDEELLGQLIHSKNKSGDTLLHTVALQGTIYVLKNTLLSVMEGVFGKGVQKGRFGLDLQKLNISNFRSRIRRTKITYPSERNSIARIVNENPRSSAI